ncbi:hypothetical protein SAY86_025874 [Trapa natans]|uniref:Uncharacterized protein n=1 Tax=Trapa natans TaxID=22666 RepID=A0AAN7KCT8_TRANT|nr:hypothetical protein SAY86_025874 [Trapa natans]
MIQQSDFPECNGAQNSDNYICCQENQKSFLNGFLGNVFMEKSYNLSAAIEWEEFACPYCSELLVAYPSTGGGGTLDG